jgi:DNA-binding response OmpR family regulator
MKASILLLEDDQALADAVSAALRDDAYDVRLHTRSMETLLAFYDQPSRFDLVILDEDMRDMPGSLLARRLLYFSPRTRILLLYGEDNVEATLRGQAAGIHWFLPKPVSNAGLLETVRAALGRI